MYMMHTRWRPEMTMSDAFSTSKNQAAAQAGPKTNLKTDPNARASKPKRSVAVIGGIGCTITVLAVAAALMAGNTTPTPPDSASAPVVQSSVATVQSSTTAPGTTTTPGSANAPVRAGQCEVPRLALMFSGTGTIRIHSGSYVSPPIDLSSERQMVSFPPPAPANAGEGSITVEGVGKIFGFGIIDHEPAGTMLLGKRGEPERSYSLGSGRYLISVGWTPRDPC
jgi:hypothetical protein